MSTYDDRLATLERKVAALELRRLYDEKKAEESTPSVQAFNLREINENMTVLLGIVFAQEENIGVIKGDMGVVKERVERLDRRLDKIEASMATKEDIASLEMRILDAFKLLVTTSDTRFPPQES